MHLTSEHETTNPLHPINSDDCYLAGTKTASMGTTYKTDIGFCLCPSALHARSTPHPGHCLTGSLTTTRAWIPKVRARTSLIGQKSEGGARLYALPLFSSACNPYLDLDVTAPRCASLGCVFARCCFLPPPFHRPPLNLESDISRLLPPSPLPPPPPLEICAPEPYRRSS